MEKPQLTSEAVRADKLEAIRAHKFVLETRGRLLEKLSKKEPHLFIQVDGFLHMEGDTVIPPDEDGDSICKLLTWELMGGSDVRVLINPRTTQDEALRLLKKMRQMIKRFGLPRVEEKDYRNNQIRTDEDIPF